MSAPAPKPLSKKARFAAYYDAFEQAYVHDDWSVVEPFFTEDAVYDVPFEPPLGGRIEGRAALLGYFKRVLDGFDRRFDVREVALLEGPFERGDSIRFVGSATYRKQGLPELRLELEETAHYDGDRIYRLEDRYEPAMKQQLLEYLEAHRSALGL
jgi:hypothetical protein